MADNSNPSFDRDNNDGEEASPLLNKNLEEQNDKKPTKVSPDAKTATAFPGSASPEYGWAVNGQPLSHGSVVVALVATMNSVAAILKSVSL
ncbi:hypothetical protein NC651_016079 [Populus alba x Populus x berolinensis]|nr:hypothetical protein NC651_016079 [Populus alba x Populus x berolinensis]